MNEIIETLRTHFNERPVNPEEDESREGMSLDSAYRYYDEKVTDWLHELEELVRPLIEEEA